MAFLFRRRFSVVPNKHPDKSKTDKGSPRSAARKQKQKRQSVPVLQPKTEFFKSPNNNMVLQTISSVDVIEVRLCRMTRKLNNKRTRSKQLPNPNVVDKPRARNHGLLVLNDDVDSDALQVYSSSKKKKEPTHLTESQQHAMETSNGSEPFTTKATPTVATKTTRSASSNSVASMLETMTQDWTENLTPTSCSVIPLF